jgi:biopolymer transport protein ExbD
MTQRRYHYRFGTGGGLKPRRITWLVIAGLFCTCTAAIAQTEDCGTNRPIPVHVSKDGSVIWNTTPVSYAEAISRFSQAAKSRPMPSISIYPDRMTKYDVVAKLLSDVEKTGFHCIGFTGIDSGR